MPESKGRKKPTRKPAPQRRRGPQLGLDTPDFKEVEMPQEALRAKTPVREIENPPVLPDVPEPATYDQILVGLSQQDPLVQESLLAARLGSMPSQRDGGMPVDIPRAVRPTWAHQLRQLGIFVIPELATHELVDSGEGGPMANHTAAALQKMDRGDLWQIAREQNPELAKLVDEAQTPEQRKAAAQQLYQKMPVDQRIALRKLMTTPTEDLNPT